MIAAPRPITIRAHTAANAAAAAIIMGCCTSLNCSTPKSYSIWNTESPMNKPPNDK
ncbi:Uncharacterised protein [Mycobacteroides abscessus subsp. abscessus]|nr:Uncharacterised protein [Mycobacteroides abscessus subsp. abscessus]SIA22349.1 Uncharacterised protein [Mycobacteroides abscessus subsp. abscessus]SIN58227.1 Uncharacterised protein [Mycobacteroides abscessus subsp. abscessus]SKV10752.1 Uncharacterised protein [Mycobacteroides abscessus subsp. abscessus]SLA93183.1 Uncharacterised protein [Mycobacteroides abscessus subsp. massiliense]